MQHSAEMRRCLIDCDVAQMRKLDQHLMPHLRGLSDGEVLISMHLSRTVMESIPFKLRAYSHAWLLNNGYPSKLPDHLKPKAERIYPRIGEAVGIAVKGASDLTRPIAGLVQNAMSDAVMDVYADSRHPDVDLVKARMKLARTFTVKKLLGKI